jgi:hypothetical protein
MSISTIWNNSYVARVVHGILLSTICFVLNILENKIRLFGGLATKRHNLSELAFWDV